MKGSDMRRLTAMDAAYKSLGITRILPYGFARDGINEDGTTKWIQVEGAAWYVSKYVTKTVEDCPWDSFMITEGEYVHAGEFGTPFASTRRMRSRRRSYSANSGGGRSELRGILDKWSDLDD